MSLQEYRDDVASSAERAIDRWYGGGFVVRWLHHWRSGDEPEPTYHVVLVVDEQTLEFVTLTPARGLYTIERHDASSGFASHVRVWREDKTQ